MRAMLDELMGEDRDGDRQKPARNFSDDDVCKFHICGFCPYEEFDKTRTDFGPCPQVHDDRSKTQWEGLNDEERAKHPYERELKKWLDKMVDDLGKKVKRNQERLDSEANPAFLPEDQATIDGMGARITELLASSQAAGEQGNVDGAQAAAAQADAVKADKTAFEADAKARAISNSSSRYGQQEVCQISGLIINSEETRVRDHKMGRNYRSWCKLHEKLTELNDTFKKRSEQALLPPPPRLPSKDREAPRSRDADKHRPGEHERDNQPDRRRSGADRERERDRVHRSSSGRDSDRHRSSTRDSDRSSHKSRDRERSHRDRHRSRSRDR